MTAVLGTIFYILALAAAVIGACLCDLEEQKKRKTEKDT